MARNNHAAENENWQWLRDAAVSRLMEVKLFGALLKPLKWNGEASYSNKNAIKFP